MVEGAPDQKRTGSEDLHLAQIDCNALSPMAGKPISFCSIPPRLFTFFNSIRILNNTLFWNTQLTTNISYNIQLDNILSMEAQTLQPSPPNPITMSSILSEQPTSFHKLPTEIFLVIFGYTDATTGVCLGLTCKFLYELLVEVRPERVPLTCSTRFPETETSVARKGYLYELLDTWMGSRYTFFPQEW